MRKYYFYHKYYTILQPGTTHDDVDNNYIVIHFIHPHEVSNSDPEPDWRFYF